MWIVKLALSRPYTIVVMSILMGIFGLFSASRMPTDIFPNINIPVVVCAWSYTGMPSWDIESRIIKLHELVIPSVVNNMARIESNSYGGFGIIKVFLQPEADVAMAVAQVQATAVFIMKQMPVGTVPPLILQYSATDVPVIQLVMSSETIPTDGLNDLLLNYVRPKLATVRGAQLPYPYGGEMVQMMVDLDLAACQAKGVSPEEVNQVIARQNLIIPSGTIKMGDIEYIAQFNNTPVHIEEINNYPVKAVGNAVVYVRDVAYVHYGHAVQTNAVNQLGHPATLMQVRKTEGNSTLTVVDGVKGNMSYLTQVVGQEARPNKVDMKLLFDQSIFVKGALFGVASEGTIAAGLTALMILLFLGNWRSTLIIMTSIPLSIMCSVIGLHVFGYTLNTMTLGGMALAVGILVDDATVEVENVERQLGLGKRPVDKAILDGAMDIAVPAMVSTFCICIVFVPIFLLQGVAKYLFSPLSLAVILALLASYWLSRTLVPTMFKFLMTPKVTREDRERAAGRDPEAVGSWNPFWNIHVGFSHAFERMREHYRGYLDFALRHRWLAIGLFFAFMGVSWPLFGKIGMDFFPTVDAGQIRMNVRCPPGTRIEHTQEIFGQVEREIRKIIPSNEIDVMLDNIGLPVSSINMAMSDSAICGAMDGEISISLTENHRPTSEYMALMRDVLPKKFPRLQFFFQPADVVNQVLNFGLQAPIDIRISGPLWNDNYRVAKEALRRLRGIKGLVDTRIFQVVESPEIFVDVDRTKAQELKFTQKDVAYSALVSLGSSGVVTPQFWVNTITRLNYLLASQTPQYWMDTMNELWTTPINNELGQQQLLMNISEVRRDSAQMMMSHLDTLPALDIQANVQGRDMAGVSRDIDAALAELKHHLPVGVKVFVAGQVDSMKTSFRGLALGLVFSVILVYLLLVVNFQSWLDPLIILMAVPVSLCGTIWMLFVTQTHISVPALMGSIMCIGLTTANSILVITFCNQQRALGHDSVSAALTAGHTRIRPVIMTALAMILGMLPMSLGLGDGGEQNAPLGRAVIGGLLVAPFAVLFFVPLVYSILRKKPPKKKLETY